MIPIAVGQETAVEGFLQVGDPAGMNIVECSGIDLGPIVNRHGFLQKRFMSPASYWKKRS